MYGIPHLDMVVGFIIGGAVLALTLMLIVQAQTSKHHKQSLYMFACGYIMSALYILLMVAQTLYLVTLSSDYMHVGTSIFYCITICCMTVSVSRMFNRMVLWVRWISRLYALYTGSFSIVLAWYMIHSMIFPSWSSLYFAGTNVFFVLLTGIFITIIFTCWNNIPRQLPGVVLKSTAVGVSAIGIVAIIDISTMNRIDTAIIGLTYTVICTIAVLTAGVLSLIMWIREQRHPVVPTGIREYGEIHKLSVREKEILVYITEGCTNNQIAEVLEISPSTVKNHISNILRKTGMRNRFELSRLN